MRATVSNTARSIIRDLQYGLRALSRNPGFSIAAILLLAVGIGGTTLVFSIVNVILLRQLPVRDPDRLARIVVLTHNRPPVSEYPYRVFDQWRQRSHSFAETFAQSDFDTAYSYGSDFRPVRAQIVTGNYYSVLGVGPLLGRLLDRKDEWATNSELPVVLSYHFWDRHFHRDRNVLGKAVHLEGRPFTIVGVTRPEFSGISVDTGPDIQVPLIAGEFLTAWGSKTHDPRRCCLWEIAGRLRPNVTLKQAEAETSQTMRAAFEAARSAIRPLSEEDRKWIYKQRLQIEPLNRGVSWLRQKFSIELLVVMAAAALLLILACGNVAGLLLARAAAQERQDAIRLALGAPRWRIASHWLSQGAGLAFLGGVTGLLITYAALPFVDALLPPMRNIMTEQIPAALHVSVDVRILVFALVLCCGVTILAALSPAWYAARSDLTTPLNSANASRRNVRTRAFLVGAQVTICTLVLANTELLVMTLRRLETMNPGFRRDHVITFTVDTGLQKYDIPQTYAVAMRLGREARELPGVAGASVAVKPLLRGAGARMSIAPIGGKRSATEELNSDMNAVSPGYFETLGIRLVAGRTFDDRDLRPTEPIPVVVNETFVQHFFPGMDGVGQHFDNAGGGTLTPRFEVIGVVADSKYRSLREAAFPALFLCIRNGDDISQSSFSTVVRTFADPKSVVSAMEKTLHGIDPNLPFREIHTLHEDIDNSLWAEHTLMRMGLLFSTLAIILVAIGLYGLLSYVVVARRREIGIRMALGAQPADILRAIAARMLTFVAAGIVLGGTGSIVTAKLLQNLLFGISPWSVQSLAISASAVAGCAVLAMLLPAVRAARLNPDATLHHRD